MASEKAEESPSALKTPERLVPKRVILDVGSGAYPFPAGVRQRKIQKGEIYIGIDPDAKHAKENFRLMSDKSLSDKRLGVGEGKGFMTIGVGERLPLRNNSVDEVVIANVIGDPKITGRPQDDLLSASPVKRIIHEIARVLKDSGQVYVVESNTPYPNRGGIIDLFQTAGLKRVKTLEQDKAYRTLERDEAYREIEQFVLLPLKGSYLLEFIKQKSS